MIAHVIMPSDCPRALPGNHLQAASRSLSHMHGLCVKNANNSIVSNLHSRWL